MTDSDLFRLVYASRNAIGVNLDSEIAAILAASRRNNPRVGVTGALLFSADCFAQVLEGPSEAVHEVFERIQWDRRHAQTVVLEAKPVTQRDFADWSMAYAGRIEHASASFQQLIGDHPAGASEVMALLRGVVGRAVPATAVKVDAI